MVINVGDTLKLGLGTYPNGDFMYVQCNNFGVGPILDKVYAYHPVVISKILDSGWLETKNKNTISGFGGNLKTTIQIEPAIKKGELLLNK